MRRHQAQSRKDPDSLLMNQDGDTGIGIEPQVQKRFSRDLIFSMKILYFTGNPVRVRGATWSDFLLWMTSMKENKLNGERLKRG